MLKESDTADFFFKLHNGNVSLYIHQVLYLFGELLFAHGLNPHSRINLINQLAHHALICLPERFEGGVMQNQTFPRIMVIGCGGGSLHVELLNSVMHCPDKCPIYLQLTWTGKNSQIFG